MASPLSHFRKPIETLNRRLCSRQTVQFAYIELGEDNGGAILNISEIGIAVQAVAPLIGSQFPHIRFQLAQFGNWIETGARMAWTNDSGKLAGLEFTALGDAEREQIKQWISLQCRLSGYRKKISAIDQAKAPAPAGMGQPAGFPGFDMSPDVDPETAVSSEPSAARPLETLPTTLNSALPSAVSPSEVASSSDSFIVWEDPEDPLAVRFALSAMHALEREALSLRDGFLAGVLLGRRSPDPQLAYVVEDYAPFPDTSRADRPKSELRGHSDLHSSLRSSMSREGLSVLGFYRSGVPREITLSVEDLALLAADPAQSEPLFMLMTPAADHSFHARFFFARDGAVAREWNPVPFKAPEREEVPLRSQAKAAREKPQAPQASIDQPAGLRGVYWLLSALALAVVFLACVFAWRQGRPLESVPVHAGSFADSHMGLGLERTGRDWRFSWNPDSPIISRATKGRLWIIDGDSQKSMDLEPSDLRGGTILYTPTTNDVVMRLEIETPDTPGVVSESVRITALQPSSPASEKPEVGSNKDRQETAPLAKTSTPTLSRSAESRPAQLRSAEPRPVESRPAQAQNDAPAARPPASSQPDHASVTAAVSKPLPTPSPELPARAQLQASLDKPAPKPAPSTMPKSAELPAPSLAPPLQRGPAPKLDAASPGLPVSAPPTQQIPVPPSQLEPAQLVVQKNPVYPESAEQNRFTGAVELRFRIGTDGMVRNVTVVKGNPVLARAAVDAVQMWRYKPARLNGAPVETEGTAVLNFLK